MLEKLGIFLRPKYLIFRTDKFNYMYAGFPAIECNKIQSIRIDGSTKTITFKLMHGVTEEWDFGASNEPKPLWDEGVAIVNAYVMGNLTK